MKTIHLFRYLSVLSVIALIPISVLAQAEATSEAYKIVRTKTMSKTARFGPGGTISLVGAPNGGISVEGWEKNEVAVEAEIVVYAENEEDAKRIASVTGFVLNEDIVSLKIHSVGTHNKKYLKKADRKFPKSLRGNPFEINYKLYVPHFSDLQIDGGKGGLKLKDVEGTFRVNYLESDAVLRLVGGNVSIIVGKGSVDVTIATRSWRGRNADVQLAAGDINLRLPKNLNADLFARVLRSGTITNGYASLEPKPRTEFTGSFMSATAGSGGAHLAFTVGEGNLNILDSETSPDKTEN